MREWVHRNGEGKRRFVSSEREFGGENKVTFWNFKGFYPVYIETQDYCMQSRRR